MICYKSTLATLYYTAAFSPAWYTHDHFFIYMTRNWTLRLLCTDCMHFYIHSTPFDYFLPTYALHFSLRVSIISPFSLFRHTYPSIPSPVMNKERSTTRQNTGIQDHIEISTNDLTLTHLAVLAPKPLP